MATWPATLPAPLLADYSLESADLTIRTDMESGPARVRRRSTAPQDRVTLRFVLTDAQQQVFRGFWESDAAHGSAWFFMPLRDARAAGVSTREVRPLAGGFKAVPLAAGQWAVSFSVELRNA